MYIGSIPLALQHTLLFHFNRVYIGSTPLAKQASYCPSKLYMLLIVVEHLSWSRSDSLKLLTVRLQLVEYIIVTVVRSSRLLLGFCLSPGLSVIWVHVTVALPEA